MKSLTRAKPQRRPRRTAMSRGFELDRLRAGVKPFRLYWFPKLQSTSDQAARLRRAGRLFAPAVVLTARQIAGRGRGGNTWWSNSGVLTVTFALPIDERQAPQELPLIAGLAVRETTVLLTGNADISLKWPNDVVYERKKLAGLLCERVGNADLVGIGLNVNVEADDAPISLRGQITSLSMICGNSLNMTDALIALARQLHRIIRRRGEMPFSWFVREYSKHDALAGQTVTIDPGRHESPIIGRCEGINDLGKLIVRGSGGVHHVMAGQVTIHPRARRSV